MSVAFRADDAQAIAPNRLEVRATRHESDIAPGLGQPAAEVAADATRAKHDDLHNGLLT
jgi:hypothetical protein